MGQDKAVGIVQDFLANFKQRSKKGLILYGPSGCGKTILPHAIAGEIDAELLEVNASDQRNKNILHELLGSAIKQRSFFSDTKVILVDEIDGMTGKDYRGGISELVRLIKETKFPMILTCQDTFDKKFKALVKVCELCQMETLASRHIADILVTICKKEHIAYQKEALDAIARKAEGDARAAINDLQLVAAGEDKITKDSYEELTDRAKIRTIESGLTTVYKTDNIFDSLHAFDEVEEDMDEQFLWMEYNTPFEYTKVSDIARAFGCLSRADIYRSRIRRRQYWRFLVYVNALMTAGVSTAKDQVYKSAPNYKRTTRLLRIWQINMSQSKKKAIAQKIAGITHASTNEIMQDFEFYHQLMKSKRFGQQIIDEAELDKDEMAWLAKANN
jgi:replication factor C large subunit